jgi:hypothetical protein
MMLLSKDSFPKTEFPEEVESFLRQDPMFSIVRDMEEADPMVSVADEAVKRRVSELLFGAERLSEGGNDESTKTEREKKLVSELVADISIELRKEERAEVARQMEEARRNGDKNRERELMKRFSVLSKG